MKFNNIIYDLDGVLIDSINLMEKSWNYTCIVNDIDINFLYFKKYLGIPMLKILKNLNINDSKHHKIKKDYEYFSSININKIELYRNVKKTVSYLNFKKINQYIVTSKNKKLTTKLLYRKNLLNFFSAIITPDVVGSNYGKPHPKSINLLKKYYGLNSKKSLFIGDSFADYELAKNSNLFFLFADWGYGNNNFNANKISSIDEIKNYI